MRLLFIVTRAAAAALILVAVITQFAETVRTYQEHNPAMLFTAIGNYVSFFTIQSNVIGAGVLIAGVVLLCRGSTRDPRWFAILMAVATTYLLTTGIVYNLLLRDIQLPLRDSVRWANEVLHIAAPLYMLFELAAGPYRRRLEWNTIALSLVYPAAWLVYTLVRGLFVTAPLTGEPWWYPYPFLDPHLSPLGYLRVSGFVAAIAVLIVVLAAAVVGYGRLLARIRVGAPASAAALPQVVHERD